MNGGLPSLLVLPDIKFSNSGLRKILILFRTKITVMPLIITALGAHLLRNTRACARGHPRLAMPDRKLVMPSFGIEMRDRSPQSRPAGWPAAGPQVMPRLDHGPRDRDEAVLAEMRAVLDKMAAIQMVDVQTTPASSTGRWRSPTER